MLIEECIFYGARPLIVPRGIVATYLCGVVSHEKVFEAGIQFPKTARDTCSNLCLLKLTKQAMELRRVSMISMISRHKTVQPYVVYHHPIS